MKSLGILGGMGAPASLRWYEEIIRIVQQKGAIQDGDYPEIYLINCKLSEWDETGITDEDSVKNQIAMYINKMSLLKPDYIVMACNTIHHYYTYLQSLTNIPIISLITTCTQNIKGTYGVMCSDTTRRMKLYGDCIYLADEEQKKIDEVILKCQSGKYYNTEHIKAAYDYLRAQGAEYVIVGCTELPLAIDIKYPNMIDAGEVLLNKVVNLLYQ